MKEKSNDGLVQPTPYLDFPESPVVKAHEQIIGREEPKSLNNIPILSQIFSFFRKKSTEEAANFDKKVRAFFCTLMQTICTGDSFNDRHYQPADPDFRQALRVHLKIFRRNQPFNFGPCTNPHKIILVEANFDLINGASSLPCDGLQLQTVSIEWLSQLTSYLQ